MRNIHKRILKIVLAFLFIILFALIIYDSGKKASEIKKQEQPKAEPLIINTADNLYDSANYIELSEACENVQKNMNVSTDEAIYAVTSEDEDNINLLARLVYSEVGNLTDEAQIATASVVLNRVNSNVFPDSIYAVIYQNGQYSCTWNGAINKIPSEQAYNNAKYVYENGTQIPKNVVYQAEFVQGSGIYKQIGNTYFCYQ